jgi:hypothetical protein
LGGWVGLGCVAGWGVGACFASKMGWREHEVTYIANHTILQRFIGRLIEFRAACYAYEEVWVVC